MFCGVRARTVRGRQPRGLPLIRLQNNDVSAISRGQVPSDSARADAGRAYAQSRLPRVRQCLLTTSTNPTPPTSLHTFSFNATAPSDALWPSTTLLTICPTLSPQSPRRYHSNRIRTTTNNPHLTNRPSPTALRPPRRSTTFLQPPSHRQPDSQWTANHLRRRTSRPSPSSSEARTRWVRGTNNADRSLA